ncbi:unnamed protein product, partial [Rotaria sp. Silwood2]
IIIPVKYDKIISRLSSTLTAILTSYLRQTMDALKTRLQVAFNRESILKTFCIIIRQRDIKGLFSGSIVRTLIIMVNSVIMMSLYEIIKRASLKSNTPYFIINQENKIN